MMYSTQQKTDALRLLRDGLFPVEVASRLGVTSWSVRAWARANGVVLSKRAGLRHAYASGARLSSDQPRLTAVSVSGSFMRRLHAHVCGMTWSKSSVCAVTKGRKNPAHYVTLTSGKAVALGDWLWGDVPRHMRLDRKYARFLEVRSYG